MTANSLWILSYTALFKVFSTSIHCSKRRPARAEGGQITHIMHLVSGFAIVVLALTAGADAFLASSSSPILAKKLNNRLSAGVCSVRGSMQETVVGRRELLGSALTFASAFALQSVPAFAEDDHKMSGDYKTG